jgi:DNA-binding winged helix-turn-helix (wHTH) protein
VAAQGNDQSPLGRTIRFDLFELDGACRQLRRSGVAVDLPPQPLRILLRLSAHPNELVTRKEIKEMLWPGDTHGDFDSRLNFAVRKLREALGDDAERPRYIQTVRNAGYRFIAPVRISGNGAAIVPDPVLRERRANESQSSAMQLELETNAVAHPPSLHASLLIWVAMAASVAALAAFIFWAFRPTHIDSVSPILPQGRQTIIIRGRGFGWHVPYARTDSPYLAIRDETGHWAAGRVIPRNWDEVTLDVEGWRDTEIVLSGFSGDYGKNGWELHAHDVVSVVVWNPQTNQGAAAYRTTVAGNASR